jgi:hypothetical protein
MLTGDGMRRLFKVQFVGKEITAVANRPLQKRL